MESLSERRGDPLSAPCCLRPGLVSAARSGAPGLGGEPAQARTEASPHTVPRGAPELRQVIARRALGNGVPSAGGRYHVVIHRRLRRGDLNLLPLRAAVASRRYRRVRICGNALHPAPASSNACGLKVLEIPDSHPKTGASLEAVSISRRRSPGAVKAMSLLIADVLESARQRDAPDDRQARLCRDVRDEAWHRARSRATPRGDTLCRRHAAGPRQMGHARGSVLYCCSVLHARRWRPACAWAGSRRAALPRRGGPAAKRARRPSSAPRAPQVAIAELIATGGYDHHLRRLRAALADHARRVAQRVQQTFPAGLPHHAADGRLRMLWTRVPREVDAIELFRARRARAASSRRQGRCSRIPDRFPNYIRLSYSQPWSPAIEDAIGTVGQIAKRDSLSRGVTGVGIRR